MSQDDSKRIVLQNRGLGDLLTSAPAITVAAIGVTGALGYGLFQMASGGGAQLSNKMMRARVLGQGAVVGMVVLIPAIGYLSSKLTNNNNTDSSNNNKY
eukprot:TRINITY_DN4202_c1_g3_i1.p1 TRINITY_DN4202_c1_g3~~TRINITY_DN4202_c1_g3_i1.p1  ORF type:complete len:99 (-),score=23.17 TRINITY_DN4202_c1_g3_i1:23-319(-)